MVKEVTDPKEKTAITRTILEALPEWFGMEEGRKEYIALSATQPLWAAFENGEAVGFLCLKPTSEDTLELAVMGIRREFHRRGIGRNLFAAAKEYAKGAGYSFLQVKTVEPGHFESYDATNSFYQSLGFKKLEVFPTLWDETNPCLVYVMAL